VIKVCNPSAFFLRLLQKYHTFLKKRLDNPLTLVYTVYVEWEKELNMSKKLTTKGEWAKHLRSHGKRIANKKHRKAHKISLSSRIEVPSAIKNV